MISSGPDHIWSPPEVVEILLINVRESLLGRRKCRAREPGPGRGWGRGRGGLTAELLLLPLTRHVIVVVVVIVVIKLVIIRLLARLICLLLCLDYFIAFKYLRTRANA